MQDTIRWSSMPFWYYLFISREKTLIKQNLITKLLRYGQTFDQIYKQDIHLADTRKSI